MIKLISVLSLIMLQPLCHVTSSIADMSPHLEGMETPNENGLILCIL